MKAPIPSQEVSFLKRFVNAKGYSYLLAPLFFLLLLAVSFQNCNTESPVELPSLPTQQQQNNPPSTNPIPSTTTMSSSTTTTTASGPTTGNLVAYLSSENASMAKDKFAINSNVVFDFGDFHSDSTKFKWTIKKGFEVEGTQETVNSQYQFQFTSAGNYEVSADSYAQGSTDVLTKAEKIVTIGDCTQDILEILTSGSLVSGQSATFGLRNASDFSSIKWKVTLPSLDVEDGTGESITVNFGQSETGGGFVEVSAVNTTNQCPTDRRRRFQVTAQLEPQFGPIELVDSNNDPLDDLALENNNIYKYPRPTDSSSVFLSLDVQNADSCTYTSSDGSANGQSVVCSGGKIDITPSTGCVENRETITASYQGSSKQKSYYHYCSLNDCFFGEIEFQPSNHVCSTTTTVNVTGLSDDTTPKNSKTWTWSCNESSCTYRYVINQSPNHTFTGNYGSTQKATKAISSSSENGTYYLHVQAKDSNNDESEVKTVLAVLEVSGTTPGNVSVTGLSDDRGPKNSKTWAWGCNKSSCTYRYVINQSQTHTLTGNYGSTRTATKTISSSSENGTYYLHVQAKDSNGDESAIKTVYVNLAVVGTTLPFCACASGNPSCGTNSSKGDQLLSECCTQGYYHPHPPDADDEFKWACKPRVTGEATVCRTVVNADNPTWYQGCSKPNTLPVCACTSGDSTCGTNLSKRNQLLSGCCAEGYYNPHPRDTDGEYKWSCLPRVPSEPGKATLCRVVNSPDWYQNCSKSKPTTATTSTTTTTSAVVCGRCGTRSSLCRDGRSGASCCSAGAFSPHPVDISATNYTWTCRNTPHISASHCSEGTGDRDTREIRCTNTGATSTTTTTTTTTSAVVCGRCGTRSSLCRDGKSGASCCRVGEFHPTPADVSATNYSWTCRNTPHVAASHCSEGTGDRDTREVRCTNPTRGLCNSAVKYGCSPSSTVATNKGRDGGYDTWHCPGSNGGATATNCKKCNTTGGHFGGASCLPSCGHARSLYCRNNSCTGFTFASGNSCSSSGYTIINLPNYEGRVCCLRKQL